MRKRDSSVIERDVGTSGSAVSGRLRANPGLPSAGQKRLSRWAPRHARSLKNCVCALQESPPRPLRRVPSTPARTLTSHVAVRLGPRRPVYVPGLPRAGREHQSKRCATFACGGASTEACAPGAASNFKELEH